MRRNTSQPGAGMASEATVSRETGPARDRSSPVSRETRKPFQRRPREEPTRPSPTRRQSEEKSRAQRSSSQHDPRDHDARARPHDQHGQQHPCGTHGDVVPRASRHAPQPLPVGNSRIASHWIHMAHIHARARIFAPVGTRHVRVPGPGVRLWWAPRTADRASALSCVSTHRCRSSELPQPMPGRLAAAGGRLRNFPNAFVDGQGAAVPLAAPRYRSRRGMVTARGSHPTAPALNRRQRRLTERQSTSGPGSARANGTRMDSDRSCPTRHTTLNSPAVSTSMPQRCPPGGSAPRHQASPIRGPFRHSDSKVFTTASK